MEHPGPWQLFRKRSDNVNLHVLAQKEKYILEESVFERKNSMNRMNMSSGGRSRTSDSGLNSYVDDYVDDYFV